MAKMTGSALKLKEHESLTSLRTQRGTTTYLMIETWINSKLERCKEEMVRVEPDRLICKQAEARAYLDMIHQLTQAELPIPPGQSKE